MVLIEINHLVKKYGEHVAVDDLTLTVEPGKIYGFLGPNGAGKSTTMNMITGYLGRDERRGEDQRSRYFCRSAGGKKMRGVFAGDTAALYGDDGAGVSGFRGRAERSG